MNCFSFETVKAFFFTIMVFVSLAPTSANVIGGGLNTVPSLHGGIAPRWLKNILSTLKFSSSQLPSANQARDANIYEVIASRDQPAAPILVHKSWEHTGIQFQTPVLSDLEKVHPFLRARRQANPQCEIPEDLPQTVLELNSYLNASQFLGLNPDSSSQEAPSSLDDQPDSCPANRDSWWPRSAVNLKSTCPWIYNETDLGEDAFPRYLRDAKCLCRYCIGNGAMGCQELKQKVTVMHRTGCENGLAVMTKKTYMVVVGCTCVSAVQQTTPRDNDGPPLTY